ncbi:MAG: leucyl aminopeptidase family protein, partial [Kangiella sp.]|nr:leucyl aminopeptidase family protein [Kangiella sp.]
MKDIFVTEPDAAALPVWPVASGGIEEWCKAHPGATAAWAETAGFSGEAGRVLLLPDGTGGLSGALLGTGKEDDPFVYAALAETLPDGLYRLVGLDASAGRKAALAWALGSYVFVRYRKSDRHEPRLV